ncbi:Imm10 family immunity protein [Actinospica robiniae]|uniref:Imm10 family immunity protein n=1 Tax=Actinospica robiniae TaxID=304901 RepID=UPI00041BBF2F|nr:Imm10 family immunity protein [Actinospica robiniae]
MTAPHTGTVVKITIDDNRDAFVVGLFEQEDGSGSYLLLMCAAADPSDQDRATGLDTYCLVDQDESVHYGGIVSAELSGAVLTLGFDDALAEELEFIDPSTLVLDVPGSDAARLAAGLRRVFMYGDPAHRPLLTGI